MQVDDFQELAIEASKASPPVTVGSLAICGVPLPDILVVVTLLYTVLQAYFLLRDKWWRQREHKK
jgi:hypothetical protein